MNVLGRATLVLSPLAGTQAWAEEIGPEAVSKKLVGATWNGINAEGGEFWFYHSAGGRFESRFVQPSKTVFNSGGRWRIEGETMCWSWDGWETHCYESFVVRGDEMSMTRSDGVVHTGTLTLGDTQGLK